MTRIKTMLKNLVYADETTYIHPLIHLFLYITLAFGLSFAFFPVLTGADQTVLYALTSIEHGGWATSLWGISAIVVTALNFVAFAIRKPWFGQPVTMLGFMIWFYAFYIYLSGGFLFGALVSSLPNMLFWAWQFISVSRYHKKFG